MKKITLTLFTIALSAVSYAQRVAPTFVLTNKSDMQIGGESELTFEPGQTYTFNYTYTLGSTDGIDDAFEFTLVRLQDETGADATTWANAPMEGTTNKWPGVGTGGMISATIEVPASTPLSSDTSNPMSYRLHSYLSFHPDGGTQKYGAEGAQETITAFVRSAAEIATLSFNKKTLEGVSIGDDSIAFGTQHLEGAYTIYNITGQKAQSGSVSSEVNIASLASGVYILTTEKGSLKFVK
ncbi:T9SS type A sorting domain-containing protein [Wenyingzhuangia sp. IMCC45574]